MGPYSRKGDGGRPPNKFGSCCESIIAIAAVAMPILIRVIVICRSLKHVLASLSEPIGRQSPSSDRLLQGDLSCVKVGE